MFEVTFEVSVEVAAKEIKEGPAAPAEVEAAEGTKLVERAWKVLEW